VCPPDEDACRHGHVVANDHDAAVVDVMAALVDNGVLLESARGPIANVAEMVAGGPIAGSWWAHPASHEIFDALNILASSPDVVRLRLVDDKVTLVHRRLWPALARLSAGIDPAALAAVTQEHLPSGRHRGVAVPLDDWLPDDARRSAAGLSWPQALAAFPAGLQDRLRPDRTT